MNIRGCRDIRDGVEATEGIEEGPTRLGVDASFEVNSRKARREKCSGGVQCESETGKR